MRSVLLALALLVITAPAFAKNKCEPISDCLERGGKCTNADCKPPPYHHVCVCSKRK